MGRLTLGGVVSVMGSFSCDYRTSKTIGHIVVLRVVHCIQMLSSVSSIPCLLLGVSKYDNVMSWMMDQPQFGPS